MKTAYFLFLLFFASLNFFGQTKIEKLKNEVLKEGFLLYESEKASWHGSDLFLAKFTEREKVGGYVSYTDGSNPKCIFISKESRQKVIGTITFDKTFDLKTATVDLTERELNDNEKEYFSLRTKAFERISSDTIFTRYKNTNYNVVPIISGKEKKVYVLTASTENGKVIIGNDYLIEFDKKGEVKKTSRLHKGMLSFDYGDDKQSVGPMHSHLPEYSQIITPTDICTTLLYQDYTKWESHYVLSKDYVSIWVCKSRELVIMTREAWEKMTKD